MMALPSLVALLVGLAAVGAASNSSGMAWPLPLWYTEEMGAVRQCVLDVRKEGNCTVTLRLDAVWACANAYSDDIRDLASYCHSRCSTSPGEECKRLWASGGNARGDEIKPYLNLAHASGICCCCPDAVSKVEISLVAAGEVADYDQPTRTALINAMAAALGLSPASITLTITAAAVNLLFTVAVADETEADAVVTRTSASLGTTAQAEAVLNTKLREQASARQTDSRPSSTAASRLDGSSTGRLQLISGPKVNARQNRETTGPPPSPPPPVQPPEAPPPPPPPTRYVSGTRGACCGAYGNLSVPAKAHASLSACEAACDADPACTSIAYTSGVSGCLSGASSGSPTTAKCPMYAGTRSAGPRDNTGDWNEALWWARGHGMPNVTQDAPWMLTVTFNVTEEQRKRNPGCSGCSGANMVLLSLTGKDRVPNQPFDHGSGDWQILFDHLPWSGQAGVSPHGEGALTMRRQSGGAWRTWDYSCTGTGVTCPGTPPQLTDGVPHTVTIHSTPSASADAIKLYVDGSLVATSDVGVHFPNFVATARAQDLHGTNSYQCVQSSSKRWMDETTLTEGVVSCESNQGSQALACGPSGVASTSDSGFWCTYDLTYSTFRGNIDMLHLENDVTEADPYAKCKPCQVCLSLPPPPCPPAHKLPLSRSRVCENYGSRHACSRPPATCIPFPAATAPTTPRASRGCRHAAANGPARPSVITMTAPGSGRANPALTTARRPAATMTACH